MTKVTAKLSGGIKVCAKLGQPVCTNTSEAGIVAHAGGGQLNAYQLKKKFNRVDTVATTGDSVKAFRALLNKVMLVQNNGAQDMELFPFLGDKFLGQVVDSSFYLVSGQQVNIYCFVAGEWTII